MSKHFIPGDVLTLDGEIGTVGFANRQVCERGPTVHIITVDDRVRKLHLRTLHT